MGGWQWVDGLERGSPERSLGRGWLARMVCLARTSVGRNMDEIVPVTDVRMLSEGGVGVMGWWVGQ